MDAWGLRGRWFRRLVAAWIIVGTTTAAMFDDGCCCCDCSGRWDAFTYPELETIDPLARTSIEASVMVLALVGGAITSVEPAENVIGTREVHIYSTTDTNDSVREITYVVTGPSGSVEVTVYAVQRANGWVVEGMKSGDQTEGSIPSFTTYSGGGGWD